MQGSFYWPLVIPGHHNIYRKIECEAPWADFHEIGVSNDQCPNNVGQNNCVMKKGVPCTLINGHGSCWHMYIYVKVSFELGNSSFIPLYGINTIDHSTEYHCIYIRPPEPGNIILCMKNCVYGFTLSIINFM